MTHGTSNLRTHDLKCWPPFFASLLDGSKTFEIRWDDRNFRVGDTLHIREYNPETQTYTGAEVHRRVTYIFNSGNRFGLQPGWAVLGLTPETSGKPARDADHCDFPDCEQHWAYVLDMALAAMAKFHESFVPEDNPELTPCTTPKAFSEFVDEHARLMRIRASAPETRDEPLLGLATTEQLLKELMARAEVGGYADYRTVDGEHHSTMRTVKSSVALTPLEKLLVEWWASDMDSAELFNRAVRLSVPLANAMSALPETVPQDECQHEWMNSVSRPGTRVCDLCGMRQRATLKSTAESSGKVMKEPQ